MGRWIMIAGGIAALASGALTIWEHWGHPPDGWPGWPPGLVLGLLAAGAVLMALGLWRLRWEAGHGHDTPEEFLDPGEEELVVAAIRRFETQTSGEIRVHLDYDTDGDPLAEATRHFETLGMTATRDRNGVLFFVVVHDHRFAVIGDEGIDRVTPADFWDDIVARVESEFRAKRYVEGLVAGIDLAGAALAEHFPLRDDDTNELPDEISRSGRPDKRRPT